MNQDLRHLGINIFITIKCTLYRIHQLADRNDTIALANYTRVAALSDSVHYIKSDSSQTLENENC